MGIMFGGDAESFMEAPRMENKGLAETIGANPIAMLLDLVGIHRQAAKGPKEPKQPEAESPAPVVVPQVLTDVSSALSPQETPITPVMQDYPMTSWGKKWLDSLEPLQRVDPNDHLK